MKRILEGAGGNAGHVGHVIVEPGGRVCGCGARGCVEAEASGTAIAHITGRPPVEAPLELRERTGKLVGRAIASVANLLDLPLAVVSGSVALGFRKLQGCFIQLPRRLLQSDPSYSSRSSY